MFGPLQIGAYLREDAFYCVLCWKCDTDEEEQSAGVTMATLHDQFSQGLDCAVCGAAIVEPYLDPPEYEAVRDTDELGGEG